MKALVALLVASATFANVAVSHADTLKNTTVTGTLWVAGETDYNDFDQSSAKIGPPVEFTGESFSGAAGTCDYTVNFSAAKVGVSDTCLQITTFAAAAAAAKTPKFDHDNFEMIFTDPAFVGDMVTPIKNGLGLSYSLTGDTLKLSLVDGLSDTNKSTFAITSAVTPEPASWQLMALGLGGLLGIAFLTRLPATADGVDLSRS